MKVLGIDPGLNGAWAFYSHVHGIECDDLPTIGEGTKRRVNGRLLKHLIKVRDPAFVIIEQVHAMPGNGSASMFRFGQAFGTIIGVVEGLDAIALRFVAPQAWKKHYGLYQADGDASRQKAIDLIPAAAPFLTRKKDHNRAEAALIALYGALEVA